MGTEKEAQEDVKAKGKRERIEKLKKDGWQSIRKERYGFKGVVYYEELRRRVERELAEWQGRRKTLGISETGGTVRGT